MKRLRLSEGDLDRLQDDDGSLAEESAAHGYSDFERDFTDADSHDLVTAGGGWVEVKSTFARLENGNKGRFRLWESQHSGLVEKDRDSTAWYVFVLWEPGKEKGRMERHRPAEVGEWVRDRGGWNESGHESMGKQHKLPWEVVY